MDAGLGCGCAWYAVIFVGGCFACHPILGFIALIVVIVLVVKMSNEEAELKKPISSTTSVSASNSAPTIKQVKKIYVDPTLRLSITHQSHKPYKPFEDRLLMQELFRKLDIEYFYHFTDERNLDSIRKYGGLLSWKACNAYNIKISYAGGDELSRQLDLRSGLEDYVRLSFCEDHPMAYRCKKAGGRLVLLQIRTNIAFWHDTLFANMNATDNNCSIGERFSDLAKINFVAVKKTYVSREDEDFKYHQAEILVKTVVPKEYIVNLDDPIYL